MITNNYSQIINNLTFSTYFSLLKNWNLNLLLIVLKNLCKALGYKILICRKITHQFQVNAESNKNMNEALKVVQRCI